MSRRRAKVGIRDNYFLTGMGAIVGRTPGVVVLALCMAILLPAMAQAAEPLITTIAGGWIGDNGPGTTAGLAFPQGVAMDASGNMYIADVRNNRIRKVDASGAITTVAGIGTTGYSGDGGPATAASLTYPQSVAVDASGNIYIADTGNHCIRKVDLSGTITTVAGNGTAGYSGDGIPANSTSLNSPQGLAIDASGNMYIADTNNNRIRMVDASGLIMTVAGNGTIGYSGDGIPATTTSLAIPAGVAVDASGNMYIADTNNNRIRLVDTSGLITTVAGNGITGYSGDDGPGISASINRPQGVFADASGNFYIVDTGNNRIRLVVAGIISTVAGNGIRGYAGDGGPAVSASLKSPQGVFVDASGNIFIADGLNDRVRRVDASGVIDTVAGGWSGDGGPATSASLGSTRGVALDASGNLYITDGLNDRIRKVDASGVITTVAGNGISGYSGDDGPATMASLNGPNGVAADRSGNIYIADLSNNRIRKVDASGIISTAAGNGTTGYSGDDGPAAMASLNGPNSVAVDASGNFYVADTNNNCIRKVDTSGVITTVAAGLNRPNGVAVDGSGNIYIADSFSNVIRRLDTSGIITMVAGNGIYGYSGDGGPATAASLRRPSGVAVDASGNIYIVDIGNLRIRRVDAAGMITTVAGTGTAGYTGDGGPAISADIFLSVPPTGRGVDVDVYGNMYIADSGNHRVRMVGSSTTTYVITAAAGANGAVSPSGPVAVNYGDSQTFTITPNAGYHIADVLVDASSVGAASSYTFSTVDAGHTITASFAINTYPITASAGAGGSVVCTPSTVDYGSNATCAIAPDMGFHITDVLVDGASVGVVGSYAFASVTAEHTVTASFAINAYTITATAGAGGAIACTPSIVNYGSGSACTITSDAGYHVSGVLVDNIPVGAVGAYAFTNVAADHAISAIFTINRYSISVSKSGTGSGTITSAPAGISCGADCSEAFDYGTSVTLAAIPDAGSVFTGWSGACSGTASCALIVGSDQAVSAAFSRAITLTSPNGGESWSRGATYAIRWTYAGDPGATVRIELLKGGVLQRAITSSTAIGSNGTGYYNWNIPKNERGSSDYTIRITSTTNSSFTDVSDGPFSIRK